LVHRILPEAVNLDSRGVQIDPTVEPSLVGKIDVNIEGANSVGQTPQQSTGLEFATDTNYPWVQINQNAWRVNSIEVTNNVTTPDTIWILNTVTWQVTEVEDDR
jgi:hypothetical protein